MQRKLSLCPALPVPGRGCDSCMSCHGHWQCPSPIFLCCIVPSEAFLFQPFTELLTSVADRESTCNLTLSFVQVITGCFFLYMDEYYHKIFNCDPLFLCQIWVKKTKELNKFKWMQKGTGTHMIKCTLFPIKYRFKTVNLKGRLPQQPYTLVKLKAKVIVKINFSLQAMGNRRKHSPCSDASLAHMLGNCFPLLRYLKTLKALKIFSENITK